MENNVKIVFASAVVVAIFFVFGLSMTGFATKIRGGHIGDGIQIVEYSDEATSFGIDGDEITVLPGTNLAVFSVDEWRLLQKHGFSFGEEWAKEFEKGYLHAVSPKLVESCDLNEDGDCADPVLYTACVNNGELTEITSLNIVGEEPILTTGKGGEGICNVALSGDDISVVAELDCKYLGSALEKEFGLSKGTVSCTGDGTYCDCTGLTETQCGEICGLSKDIVCTYSNNGGDALLLFTTDESKLAFGDMMNKHTKTIECDLNGDGDCNDKVLRYYSFENPCVEPEPTCFSGKGCTDLPCCDGYNGVGCMEIGLCDVKGEHFCQPDCSVEVGVGDIVK